MLGAAAPPAAAEPMSAPNVVALVGVTASGKSEVALRAAMALPSLEVVSVDSMAVYRGMDIGTAKPDRATRARVPYHLIDLVDPSEEFTVQQFQAEARSALAGIASRNHGALLVGGTGLYLRSVVDDLSFPGRYPDVAASLTEWLEAAGPDGSDAHRTALEALHRRLVRVDPAAAGRIAPSNRRRLVRALEVTIGSGRPFSSFGPGLDRYPPTKITLVGLRHDPAALDERIATRFHRLMELGFLDEVHSLAAPPGGLSKTARQALGYRELLSHIEEDVPLESAVDLAVQRTRAYARRQVAWFRRDPRIGVVGPGGQPGRFDRGPLRRRPRGRGQGGRLGHSTMSPSTPTSRRLDFTKHHGAGNDFLVLVDMADAWPIDPALGRALCDRRFGVGADGVIRIIDGGGRADLGMDLHNADGSVAEMSGNGIRCLAQAAVAAGLVEPPTFTVSTLSGVRCVEFVPGEFAAAAEASVDMGVATLGADQPQQFSERRARRVDMGNPHLVLLGPEPAQVDVAELGSRLQGVHPGGINVEFISVGPGPNAITLRVWERGVGETQACGTGSAAAAAAARSWGLVGETVDVHNPGGTLRVEVASDGIRLSGPVRKVADVEVDVSGILVAARS